MKKENKANGALADVQQKLSDVQQSVIGILGEAADTYIGLRNYVNGRFYFTDIKGKDRVLAPKGKPGDHIPVDFKTWNILKEQRESIGMGHQGRDDSILTATYKRAAADKDISPNTISDEDILGLATLHIDDAVKRFSLINNLNVMKRIYSLLDQADKRPVELLDHIEKAINITEYSLPKNFYEMGIVELKALAETKGLTSYPAKSNTTHEMRDVILDFMSDVS